MAYRSCRGHLEEARWPLELILQLPGAPREPRVLGAGKQRWTPALRKSGVESAAPPSWSESQGVGGGGGEHSLARAITPACHGHVKPVSPYNGANAG